MKYGELAEELCRLQCQICVFEKASDEVRLDDHKFLRLADLFDEVLGKRTAKKFVDWEADGGKIVD